MEELVRRPELTKDASSVLDYGCGSGVLALAALALGPPSLVAHATDVSQAALECASVNGELNGAGERLRLHMPWELSRSLRVETALANMLPGPLISVSTEIAERVAPGGTLLTSGFRECDEPAVCDAFSPYFSREGSRSRDGWLALTWRRSNAGVDNADLSEAAVS